MYKYLVLLVSCAVYGDNSVDIKCIKDWFTAAEQIKKVDLTSYCRSTAHQAVINREQTLHRGTPLAALLKQLCFKSTVDDSDKDIVKLMVKAGAKIRSAMPSFEPCLTCKWGYEATRLKIIGWINELEPGTIKLPAKPKPTVRLQPPMGGASSTSGTSALPGAVHYQPMPIVGPVTTTNEVPTGNQSNGTTSSTPPNNTKPSTSSSSAFQMPIEKGFNKKLLLLGIPVALILVLIARNSQQAPPRWPV